MAKDVMESYKIPLFLTVIRVVPRNCYFVPETVYAVSGIFVF